MQQRRYMQTGMTMLQVLATPEVPATQATPGTRRPLPTSSAAALVWLSNPSPKAPDASEMIFWAFWQAISLLAPVQKAGETLEFCCSFSMQGDGSIMQKSPEPQMLMTLQLSPRCCNCSARVAQPTKVPPKTIRTSKPAALHRTPPCRHTTIFATEKTCMY